MILILFLKYCTMNVTLTFDEINKRYLEDEKYDYYSGFVELVFENLQKKNSQSFTINLFCKEVINLFAIKNQQFHPDTDYRKSNLLAVSCLYLDLYTDQNAINYASQISGLLFWKKSEKNNGNILMIGLTDILSYAKQKQYIW